MLIQSQDKKAVFDMSNCCIGIISENRENCICIKSSGNPSERYLILGRYQTEERAIEVLDEICMFYIGLNSLNSNAAYVKNGVFRMPEV